MSSAEESEPVEYDDEEKHALASNVTTTTNGIEIDNDTITEDASPDRDHSPSPDVTFQLNDVDSMNYSTLYDPEPPATESMEPDHMNPDPTALESKHSDADDDPMTLKNEDESDRVYDSRLFPISGLRIHEEAVCGLTTSPHQALIASVGDDYRLVLYKINSDHRLQCIRRIKKKYLPVSISFDNTGDCLAISMIDGVIEIWDVSTMKPIYTLKGHTGSVLKSIWSPTHRNTLASFSNDQTIRVWHPHSMPSTRSSNIIQLQSMIQDIDWQKSSGSNDTLLSSVDNKNTLRLYSSSQDFKQIYVGRSMGDRLAFGQQSLIAVNGYNLNLFDCLNLNRLNCIRSNKYHSALINNIALQHIPSGIGDDVNLSQNGVSLSNSKGLFATTDRSEENALCVWQFHDDCANARCVSRILNAHNRADRAIYSLRLKEKVPSAPSSNTAEEKGNQLPVPTAFEDSQSDDRKKEEEDIQDESEEDDEFENDYSAFITDMEFCKHSPQYLLTAGRDGTVKLWDCNQLTGADHDNSELIGNGHVM